MRDEYGKQLQNLKEDMIKMGAAIKDAIGSATSALIVKDINLAKEVMAQDEIINSMEHRIGANCLKLLLFQQPVATDLRQVSTSMKIITDLERIGDYAVDISELVLLLKEEDYTHQICHIRKMSTKVIEMVEFSMEAYKNLDVKEAERVVEMDDDVDELFLKVKEDVINLIASDKSSGEQATDLMMVSKYLERIGDHAVNVANYVIYAITGEPAKDAYKK